MPDGRTIGISGLAVGLTGAGAIVLYAGVKGISIQEAIRTILAGKNPANLPQASPIAGTPPGLLPNTPGIPGMAGAITSSEIANDALNYVGGRYLWGGANPTAGGADCSGFVNWVLSHDLGLPIPGYRHGGFTGQSHGANTLVWLAWPGKRRISRNQVQAGDLIIWQSHMGIAINNTDYVSAFDTQEGIVVHPIHGGGPIGEIATFWRLKVTTPSGGAVPAASLIPHKR